MRAALLASGILFSSPALSQPVTGAELENVIRTLRVICVSGQAASATIEAGLRARLQSLGATGQATLTAKQFEGAVGYVDESLRSLQDVDIRRCMQQNFSVTIETLRGRVAQPPMQQGEIRSPPPAIPPGDEALCKYNLHGFRTECNVTFSGFVVDSKDPPFYQAGSIERCAAFCRGRLDCVAFTMADAPRSSCFLYKSVSETRYQTPMISGFKSGR